MPYLEIRTPERFLRVVPDENEKALGVVEQFGECSPMLNVPCVVLSKIAGKHNLTQKKLAVFGVRLYGH